VIFVPYLGYKLLPRHGFGKDEEGAHDPYASPFYRRLHRVIAWCVDRRALVIVISVAAFAASLARSRSCPRRSSRSRRGSSCSST